MATSHDELLSNFHRLQVTRIEEQKKEGVKDLSFSAGIITTYKYGISNIPGEFTAHRHRRHMHYPCFETKNLLQSLQQCSTNRCTKSKIRATPQQKRTTVTLRPSKLTFVKNPPPSVTSLVNRRTRRQVRRNILESITEEVEEAETSTPLVTATEPLVPLQQSCSQQATNNPELNINELASYLDLYLHLPKKMSAMAEMMYT